MPRTLRRSTNRSAEPEVHEEATEETAPRRSRRSAEPERSSRRRSRDEDEDAPTPEVADGWGGYEENRQEYDDYAPDFGKTLKEAQDDDEDVLFKFIDEAPFAVYKQHWIERKGKKSFNCIGRNCPLCNELGDRPATKVAFNVVDMYDPEKPVLAVWTVGQKIADMIKKMSTDKKSSPLNREDVYFSARRSGTKGGSVQTNISVVKERDLGDDWDTEPLTSEQLDEFDDKAYDKTSIDYQTVKQLEEVVDEA